MTQLDDSDACCSRRAAPDSFVSVDSLSARAEGASWTLFLVSTLGLFLELMLIRWIGTEIRIFAYLQNTVLVVCFMGLGLGCLRCRDSLPIRGSLLTLLLLLLLFAL